VSPANLSEPIKSVSCGGSFMAYVNSNGLLFCFGENDYGQLGTGDTASRRLPFRVTNIPPISSVTCGWSYTVCIDEKGSVWSFGYNLYGQLGLGHSSNERLPKQLALCDIKSVSCGYAHTIFLDENGKVFSCGYNLYGQLGVQDTSNKYSPCAVSVHSEIVQVLCGYAFSILVDYTGKVFVMGCNDEGQLGLGDKADRKCPAAIPNLNVKSISCGYCHTVCVNDKNVLLGWGVDSSECLMGESSLSPKVLRNNVLQVATGAFFTFFKTHDGEIYCCGDNSSGQLGIGITDIKCHPTKNTNISTETFGDPLISSTIFRKKSARK